MIDAIPFKNIAAICQILININFMPDLDHEITVELCYPVEVEGYCPRVDGWVRLAVDQNGAGDPTRPSVPSRHERLAVTLKFKWKEVRNLIGPL